MVERLFAGKSLTMVLVFGAAARPLSAFSVTAKAMWAFLAEVLPWMVCRGYQMETGEESEVKVKAAGSVFGGKVLVVMGCVVLAAIR
jgi:hypothetical protein